MRRSEDKDVAHPTQMPLFESALPRPALGAAPHAGTAGQGDASHAPSPKQPPTPQRNQRKQTRTVSGERAPARAPRTKTPEPRTACIRLGGSDIPYIVRVSARARRLRLLVRPSATGGAADLEVVTPRGVGNGRIEAVLREKQAWVLRTLRRMAEESSQNTPPTLRDGMSLPFAGRTIWLALRTGTPVGRFRGTLAGDVLTLATATGEQEVVRAALEAWYRREAKVVFAERLAVCNAVYGFTFGRVSIKEQKSRWGSCSRQGNLNFNWRLLLAPLPVLDYVVTHELAHLREMNHSPRFWQVVARGCPEYQAHRRWLRAHGTTLRI